MDRAHKRTRLNSRPPARRPKKKKKENSIFPHSRKATIEGSLLSLLGLLTSYRARP